MILINQFFSSKFINLSSRHHFNQSINNLLLTLNNLILDYKFIAFINLNIILINQSKIYHLYLQVYYSAIILIKQLIIFY